MGFFELGLLYLAWRLFLLSSALCLVQALVLREDGIEAPVQFIALRRASGASGPSVASALAVIIIVSGLGEWPLVLF